MKENKEHLRIEIFRYGDQLGAINWHSGASSSELTVETNLNCQDIGPDDNVGEYSIDESNGYRLNNDFSGNAQFGDSNITNDPRNRTSVEERNVPRNISPTLSDIFEWNVESTEKYNCNVHRLLETEFDKYHVTTRVYQDALYIFSNPHYRKKMRELGKVFEENIVMKNDDYLYNITFSDGYKGRTFSGIFQNNTNNTNIQLMTAVVTNGIPLFGDIHPEASLDLEINKSQPESHKLHLNYLKLQWNYEKIFEGWFYQANIIQKIAIDQVPTYLKKYLEMRK